MDLQSPCAGGGMITLNPLGHKERRSLIKSGVEPKEAHERALSKPENQYPKPKRGKK